MATILVSLTACWARRDDAPPFEDPTRSHPAEEAHTWACRAEVPADDPLGLCAHHRAQLARRVPR
ncbi:MAG TPA: hypothetical protein VG276_28970 [Actinomycetes bacterium]|jgi:hypothetical protein|nr:hypothetical protein [Actinomycetes bacterium]